MQISKRALLGSKHDNLVRLAKYLQIEIEDNIEHEALAEKILWYWEWQRIKNNEPNKRYG